MIPGNRAALSLVPDEPDQVPRLERFRAAHPEVIILLRGPVPTAWVGGRKIVRRTLRDLVDDLEEIFPPPATGRLAGGTCGVPGPDRCGRGPPGLAGGTRAGDSSDSL